ncbi:hypothetical protein BCR35DRAFT_351998 [Leucosporidium creatinivorum]|uniref:Uncharacterized protein n=1 Tax=Leucosporidium creatinivorum TaxID=106004 RepID=A0A1Y2FIV6_9BASI|nr:hypothetical protein BCR35DRAFT_351998 [Leucosporidium creatinivorum]
MAKDYVARAIFAILLSALCTVIIGSVACGIHDARWKHSYLNFEPELHAFAAEAFSLWSKYCTSRSAEALAEQCELWRRAKDVQATRVREDLWWILQWKDFEWAKWVVAGAVMLVIYFVAALPEEGGGTERMEKKKDSAKEVELVVVDAATQSSS